MAFNYGIQGLEQFCRSGTDGAERTVAQAVVAVTDIIVHPLFVGRDLCEMVLAAERIQVYLRSLYRLVDIYLYGVGSDDIGVGEVAVQARHALLTDDRVLGFPVEIQRLEDVLLCGDVVALRYVERYHVAGTLPLAVGLTPLDGGALHLLQEFQGAQGLEVIVEVILDQFIGLVVVLGVTEFVGDVLQFLLHLQDAFVLFLGGKHLARDQLASMLEPLHVIQRLRFGVPAGYSRMKKRAVRLIETFLADKELCLTEILVAFVVQVVWIVLPGGLEQGERQCKYGSY